MDEKIKKYSDETKLLKKLTEDSIKSSLIEPDLYTLYDVQKKLEISGVMIILIVKKFLFEEDLVTEDMKLKISSKDLPKGTGLVLKRPYTCCFLEKDLTKKN